MPSIWGRSDAAECPPVTVDGRFYDGVSSARRDVSLAVDVASQSLVLTDATGVVDRWPFGVIRFVERPVRGFDIRYRRSDQDGPRLTAGQESVALLARFCPDLHRAPAHERQTARLAFWVGAAIIALLVLVLFSLPRFAHELALITPAPLEDRIGRATETTIRRILGFGQAAPLCTASAGRAALDRLAARLAAAADMPPPQVEVLNVPILNAVAIPGRRVLVFRTLIDDAPDADALAGVLGHEFGHVAYRHPLEGAIRQSGLSLLIGLFIGDIYGGSVAGGAALVLLNSTYSRDDERTADRAALTTLAAAGIDSAGMVKFFELVGAKEREAGIDKWPSFAMSHPGSGEREDMFRRDGRPGGPAMTEDDWQAVQDICDSGK
jgi:Zn-dependent protease with chaperone function